MQNEYSDPAFQQFAMNMNLTAYASAAPMAQYPTMASPSQPTYDQASASTNLVHRRRRSAGGRRMSPDDLIPLDAPTQPRRYLAPSATSKKDVPSYYTKRPSYGRLSDDEQEDELNEEPPAANATDQEKIEWKRRQNTLAARRSRKRKLLQQQQLEQAVEDLTREKEIWRTRALTLRQLLISHGILCPDFKD
ncbi:hypothetical protein EST38_g8146 [Candolleomyces aberdarensis]|uniref:BZIP domain-containing protein n=1 Tax=Candolleomyces aberdarensis TaxID=2316362 RepID=A0A4Q2DDA2_9AGAR|nr:hypothetical protein EST38_g8146 [Candolleomyces aberdarensis]